MMRKGTASTFSPNHQDVVDMGMIYTHLKLLSNNARTGMVFAEADIWVLVHRAAKRHKSLCHLRHDCHT